MERVKVARHAWGKIIALLSAAALLVVACTSSGGGGSAGGASSPASPPPAGAVCQDLAALRASVERLAHTKVDASAVDSVTAGLKELRANLTALTEDAHGQWQAQTTALRSAAAQLQTAVKALAAHPGSAEVAGVVTAAGAVGSAAQQLLAAASARCPSAAAFAPAHDRAAVAGAAVTAAG